MKAAVVYIITKLELGGAQKVCLTLFKGMQEHGTTATLISGAQGALLHEVEGDSHAILLRELKREVSLRYVWLEIKTFFNLIWRLRSLKKKHPNLIVHTHSTKAGLLGRWAAFFARVKKRVHTVHGYGFHDRQPWLVWLPIYFLELITGLITTHYICVSEEDVATGKRLLPRFRHKYSLIRAAVNERAFIPAYQDTSHDTREFVFGTISCFKPQKNIWDLLRSFEWVYRYNTNARLEIIGDGILRNDIEQWIRERNLSSVITLHGWQHNVAPFLKNWDVFTLSSLWEGLPCSIIEARLMKLPVLSYNTGGIHEVIFSGKNGFLYERGNWIELAHGMLNVMQQPQLYERLRSFNDDLHDFTSSAMIKQHITVYKSLAG